MAALDVGDEYFWMPERLVPFEHWVGHIPFVFWLVKVLGPRRFVELGTHRGNSYCAMCQAVAACGIDARGHAVDTWQGDLHMAFETGLLDDLRRHHDPRYAAFSTLMPMTFDEARGTFADGSVDLLHIDGTHTYDAVRHDFETWLPTLSRRGVVLFHDTDVRQDDFGVWQFWEEVSARYPSFQFLHSYGLGVLGVGADLPEPLRALFGRAADPAEAEAVRRLFSARGDALVDHLLRSEAEGQLRAASAEVARLREAASAEVARLQAAASAEVARLEAAASAEVARLEAAASAEAARLQEAVAELDTARTEWEAEEAALHARAGARVEAATAIAQREIALRAGIAAELEATRTLVAPTTPAPGAEETPEVPARVGAGGDGAAGRASVGRMLRGARRDLRRLGRRLFGG